jgi:hypothetical protein
MEFIRGFSSLVSVTLLLFSNNYFRATISLHVFIIGKVRKVVRNAETELTYVPLVPPGKIVHLVKVSPGSSRVLTFGSPTIRRRQAAAGDTERYKPIWASNDDFGEIQITSSFFSDHNPTTVCHELERIAESFGLSPPYFLPPEE